MAEKNYPIRFLHLVDHRGGTISNLLSHLSSYSEHRVLTSSFNLEKTMNLVDEISKYDEISVILHATGNNKPFYNKKKEIFRKFKRSYLFLHVSPAHFLIKDRLKELENIEKLVNQHKIGVLTPSNETKKEFSYYGINAIPIQLGVNFRPEKYKPIKEKDKRYITTVCTAQEGVYYYIKGIDRFYKLIRERGLEKEAIILGNGSSLFKGIKSKRLTQDNFIEYLRKSKVYIQLSRTESYNLSAVYAKLLKIPVIVSNIEGHIDNVKSGFRTNSLSESKKILENILNNPQDPDIKKILEENYQDSIRRENLNNFKNSFNKL